jgi:hypothetical protein
MKRGDIAWGLAFFCITAFLIIPATNEIFTSATKSHPYLLGFIKFAIMATMGELLSIRIGSGKWKKITGISYKAIIWGIVGMLSVLMFSLYSNGVAGAIKDNLILVGEGKFSIFLTAFLISAIMNLTFSPVFMAAHSISNTYIDMRAEGKKIKLGEVISAIDWQEYIKFVVGKTIPFLWIPAHTVTFLLPSVYRVIVAAYLSIVLGVILAYARNRKAK